MVKVERGMAKILIIDDEDKLIKMLQMRLEANEYEVITANNGKEGLEKAKTENPDLILLDVVMTRMDGYEVCAVLKKDAQYNKIPIILYTNKAQDDFEEMGRSVGADVLTINPFDAPDLLAKIEELLKK